MTPQIDSQADITAAEAEQSRSETAVNSELNRLKGLRREAASHVERARAQAEDPGLVAALADVAVPSINVKTQLDESRMARLKVLAIRKACMERARNAISVHERELDGIFGYIREQEQAAKQRAMQKPVLPPPPPAPAMEEAGDDLAATMIRAIDQQKLEPVQRRAAARVSLCAEITMGSDSNFFTGFTNDLSEGGVFVATVNLLPLGTQIDLAFQLPGGPKIQGKGEVRWLREFDDKTPDAFPGMGIRFIDVPGTSIGAIHAFTQQREPLFFPES